MSKPRIVIAGGGMAGHKIAYELQQVADVTLVDPKDFFEIPMAAPRLLVAPGSLSAIIPYREFLAGVRVVRGRLVEARDRAIVVERTEPAGTIEIPFDYLVLATGANYEGDLVKPIGGEVEERLQHYRLARDRLAGAERVLIVGGGAVGVELAGEIVEKLPGKQITLVEAGPRLLPPTSEKPRRWAAAFLQQHGVRILTGEKIVEPATPAGNFDANGGVAVTDKGAKIPYDVGLWCVGLKPDASYMKAHFQKTIDARGLIRVTRDLRVVGQQRIFAVGDINDLPEKGALWVQYHAKVMIKNLKRLIASESSPALAEYKRPLPPTTMLVTLGRNNGVMDLPFGKFRWGWLSRKLKGEHMLVPPYRKGVGLPPLQTVE